MLSTQKVETVISELMQSGACAAALIDSHGFILGADGTIDPDLLGALGSLISSTVEQVAERLETKIYELKMRTGLGLLIGRPAGELFLFAIVDREEAVDVIEQTIQNGTMRIRRFLAGIDIPPLQDVATRENILAAFLKDVEPQISPHTSGYALEQIMNCVEEKLIELGLVDRYSSVIFEIYTIVRTLRFFMNSPPPEKVVLKIRSLLNSWKKRLSNSNY